MTKPTTSLALPRVTAPASVAVVAIVFALCGASGAAAGDLQGQLSAKRDQLQADQAQQTALSSTLEHYSSEIDQLSGQVAALRDREATVQGQLDAKEAELRHAKARLARVRVHLHKSLKVLRQRLVATYESNQPDILNVILNSHGFNQLNSRFAYLQSIEHQDASIVASVRRLRNDVRDTVDRIHSARDRLAAKRAELARTETQLQARQSALTSARDQKQTALSEVQANSRQLQGEISDIQGRIAQAAAARQAAVQAAQQAEAAPTGTTSSSALTAPTTPPASSPLGPVPPGQAISPFPASSPITWGRTDQGIDGTTTPGSQLLAMGSGTVTIGHDPAGFGDSYPILHTSFGDFYYGHCVPTVADGARVSIGQPIATAHTGTWGNSTTPGGFEIGAWPPGDMTAGAAIRSWLIGLPRR
jgi:peptidoglycan hydrolase CwlO-like protein